MRHWGSRRRGRGRRCFRETPKRQKVETPKADGARRNGEQDCMHAVREGDGHWKGSPATGPGRKERETMSGNAAVEAVGAEVQREPIAALVLESAEVPTRILVAPWGEVRSALGTFVVDAESAAAT